MNIKDENLRFPFDKYKSSSWSLEHIHAQNAETLNTTEKRKEWLAAHKEALYNIKKNDDVLHNEEENEGHIKNIIDRIEKLEQRRLF